MPIRKDLQQQVQQAIDELVESRAERGLQVAVYLHGEQLAEVGEAEVMKVCGM
jgi:hypothetical protein